MTIAIPNTVKQCAAGFMLGVALACVVTTQTACPFTQAQVQTFEQGLQTSITDIGTLMPIVPSILGLIVAFNAKSGPGTAFVTDATNVANQITPDLQIISSLLASVTSATATTVIQKIQAEESTISGLLPQILTAAHIVDSATVAKVTALANTVIATINAVIAWLHGAFNLAVARVGNLSSLPKLPKPSAVQKQISQILAR